MPAIPTTTPTAPPGPPSGAAASRQHTLRERNLRLVAAAVYEATSPPSRADVAAATGLTRATVSTLVDRLVAGGLLAELPPVVAQRAGRPAVPLEPARRTLVGLGLEVNVDYLGVRALDLVGDVVAERVERGSFHDSDPGAVLTQLRSLAAEVIAEVEGTGMRVAGARLALPGLVDSRRGRLEVAPNLGWSTLDPVDVLDLRTAGGQPLAVEVANEAKLAALAQLPPAGSGQRHGDVPSSFLYVSGDVGVGAGVVVDRALFLGERGWNGEIGHVVVDPAGPRCSCGNSGCLEQYAGKEVLLRGCGLSPSDPVDAVVELLRAGDDDATDAVRRGGRALGAALATFVNLVDVSTVVLGGAYADLFDWLGSEVADTVRARALAAPFAPIDVRPAVAGPHAALTGGAREVLRAVVADPALWM